MPQQTPTPMLINFPVYYTLNVYFVSFLSENSNNSLPMHTKSQFSDPIEVLRDTYRSIVRGKLGEVWGEVRLRERNIDNCLRQPLGHL